MSSSINQLKLRDANRTCKQKQTANRTSKNKLHTALKNSEKQLSIENKRYAVLYLWYADKTSGMQMWYFGLQQLNLFCMWFAGWKGEVRR